MSIYLMWFSCYAPFSFIYFSVNMVSVIEWNFEIMTCSLGFNLESVRIWFVLITDLFKFVFFLLLSFSPFEFYRCFFHSFCLYLLWPLLALLLFYNFQSYKYVSSLSWSFSNLIFLFHKFSRLSPFGLPISCIFLSNLTLFK